MARPPANEPGERRLTRPPSERYRPIEPETGAPTVGGTGSAARAVGLGAVAGLVGAIGIVLLGEIALVTAGLLAWAVVIGWAIALAVRTGGRSSLDRAGRIALSAGLALAAVGLGQLGLWAYADAQGGVLPLVEYLAQTFGILVPLEFALAAGVAWWTAR